MYCVIAFIWNVQNMQIHSGRSGFVVARKKWEVTANGCGVLFWDDENVLKLDLGDVCTTL